VVQNCVVVGGSFTMYPVLFPCLLPMNLYVSFRCAGPET
jgi:hypothetical protein